MSASSESGSGPESGPESVEPAQPAQPVLRIVRGEPTPEELAVVTAVVTAAGSGGAAESPEPRRGRWNDPAAVLRGTWLPGPGAWRSPTR